MQVITFKKIEYIKDIILIKKVNRKNTSKDECVNGNVILNR